MSKEVTEKKVLTAGSASYQLIGEYILWQIPFYILFILCGALLFVVPALILPKDSVILIWAELVIKIAVSAVATIFVWKFSTKSVFKKCTMTKNLIPKVIKILAICLVIISVLCALLQRKDIKNEIKDHYADIENEIKLDSVFSLDFLLSEEEAAARKQEREKLLQDLHNQEKRDEIATLIASLVLNLLINYILLFKVEKPELEKYATDELAVALPGPDGVSGVLPESGKMPDAPDKSNDIE